MEVFFWKKALRRLDGRWRHSSLTAGEAERVVEREGGNLPPTIVLLLVLLFSSKDKYLAEWFLL